MRADLGAFLDDAHADLVLVLGGKLLQTYRRGQTCRPGADDDDVVLHRFASHVPLLVADQESILRKSDAMPIVCRRTIKNDLLLLSVQLLRAFT